MTSESLEPKAHGVADAARQTTQARRLSRAGRHRNRMNPARSTPPSTARPT
ncbi:hypothetical protein [Pseudoscardovia radai]|uniref:hypothetical protein n=1 Tax=Pseudoscardovia radai TaxID=987066 RepID=UPI0039941AAC